MLQKIKWKTFHQLWEVLRKILILATHLLDRQIFIKLFLGLGVLKDIFVSHKFFFESFVFRRRSAEDFGAD